MPVELNKSYIFKDELPVDTRSSRRLRLFKAIVALNFFVGILFTWKLWISTRVFPLTPVADFFAPFPFPWDLVLVGFALILLGCATVAKNPKPFLYPLLCLLGFLFLQDQSRLYPSFYEYTSMLLVIMFYPWREENEQKSRQTLNICRLIVISIYFWSGVQKLNPYFVDSFMNLIDPLVTAAPRIPWRMLVSLIPYFEIAFALGLLTQRFRVLSLTVALSMHGFVFFLIGPLRNGWNDTAWAWNLGTAMFATILFLKAKTLSFKEILWNRTFIHTCAFILFGFLPLLNFFGLWDSALSFNVYSGNTTTGLIYMDSGTVTKLPIEIEKNITWNDTGKGVLNINNWSNDQFNAGVYPEVKIFEHILDTVCGVAMYREDIEMSVTKKLNWFETERIHLTSRCSTPSTRV